jgi:hypothetical protein
MKSTSTSQASTRSRGCAAALRLAGGDSSARLASAIEFLLEGLHLSNRLNKQVRENGALYTRS